MYSGSMEKPPNKVDSSLLSSIRRTLSPEAGEKKVSELVDENEKSLTSRETHEKLKKSSVDVGLKTNTKRFWAGYLSQFGNHLIMSSFIAIGAAIGISSGGGLVIGGMILGGLALGIVGHAVTQNANRQSSENSHDVNDYYNKRTAALNAKAFKQELFEKTEPEKAEPASKKSFVNTLLAERENQQAHGKA